MSPQHATDLAGKIQQLQADRQRHVDAMAAIDRVLGQIGDAVRGLPAAQAAGATSAPAPAVPQAFVTSATRRHRGTFERTGVDSVLDFIRRHGDPTTADINAHWRNEGRRATANVTLLKLLKAGIIRREVDHGIRGSRYCLNDHEPSRPAIEASATANRG